METDGTFGRPVTRSNIPIVYGRRGPRWVPAHTRQFSTDDNGNLPLSCGYSRVTTTLGPHIRQQIDIDYQKNVARTNQDRFPIRTCAKDQILSKRPQFHAIYLEFENMKKMGLLVNADQQPEPSAPQNAAGHPRHEMGRKQRSPSEHFAEAMNIFMKSYLSTSSSLTRAKHVDDWSKEAGDLLNELTDNERSALDLDKSVWNIPSDTRAITTGRTTSHQCNANPWSTTALKSHESEFGGARFDIHRHIKEIKPSPYPGGSPLSSGQSSSNHSSDNDADDESTQSPSENTCSKAIGAKKCLTKRFNSSLTCSTLDSGYLSSATESGGAKGGGIIVRVPGTSVDSDDFSSECGFASSAGLSWPTSPQSPKPTPLPDRSRKGLRWSDGSSSKVSFDATDMSLPRSAFPQRPQKFQVTCPPNPIPLPMSSFVSSMTGNPLPPLPLLTAQFPPVAQPPLTTMSRFPSAMSALPGLVLMGDLPSLSYTQQLRSHLGQAKELVFHQGLTGDGTYHKHKAWITDEILEMIAVRDRLYKRMKKHPAPDIVEMYKKVRNMVVGMTRNAKRSYEKRLEEQQMEQQLRDSRQVKNLNSLNNSLSIGFRQKYVAQTW